MRLYLLPVMGVCFGVDGLLLAGTAKLSGEHVRWGATALAALLGAAYGGACLLQEALGAPLWRLVSLLVMGVTAFGFDRAALGRTALFLVLNMAAGGLSLAMGEEKALLAAIVVCLLCLLALGGRPGRTVPVSLRWRGQAEDITALRDTGHSLCDPVTGEQVLVVSAQVAGRLFGLDQEQLKDPVQTMTCGSLPGLRLIPYNGVGGKGLLLGMRLPDVQVGKARGSMVVAFAPTQFGGNYQALTGGTV